MTTVAPATSTERPAVASASTTASPGLSPGGHGRSMTGEDEQRVVDADAEAHHHAELRRPVGHVGHRGEDAEQRAGDREAEERGERSGRPAATTVPNVTSRTIAAATRPMSSLDVSGGASMPRDELAADGRVQAGRRMLGQRDERLAGALGDVVGPAVERQARDGGRAVARDLGLGRGRRRSRCPRSPAARWSIASAAACAAASRTSSADHTRSTLYCERPVEALLEHGGRGLGLRAGRRVVGAELAGGRAAEREGADRGGDPREQHDAATAERERRETAERGPFVGSGRSVG